MVCMKNCCRCAAWSAFVLFALISSFWVGWHLYAGSVYDANIRDTLGYQIHSWNDLREWPQAMKKGATWLKVDVNMPQSKELPDLSICRVQENLSPSSRQDPRGCLLLAHDAPDIRQKYYSTSEGITQFLADPTHRHLLQGNETIHIALCFKVGFNPCQNSTRSMSWLSLVDQFIEETNRTIHSLSLNVNLVLDGEATPGRGRKCLNNRWRPFVSTYIFNQDPFCALFGNSCEGGDRFQIWNQPVPHWYPGLLIELFSYVGYGKFGRQSEWPLLVWEPDRQDIIMPAAYTYVRQHISQKAGFRFAINIDPVKWQVYTSPVSRRGFNVRLESSESEESPIIQTTYDAEGHMYVMYVSWNIHGKFNTIKFLRNDSRGYVTEHQMREEKLSIVDRIVSVSSISGNMMYSDITGHYSIESVDIKGGRRTRLSSGKLNEISMITSWGTVLEQNSERKNVIFHMYQTHKCSIQLSVWTAAQGHDFKLKNSFCVSRDQANITSASFDVEKDPSRNSTWSSVITWSEDDVIRSAVVDISEDNAFTLLSTNAIDVGRHTSVSLASDGAKLHILEVHGEGFDYNSEEKNKNPLLSVCDQVPVSTAETLVYNWATLSEWTNQLVRNEIVSSCHGSIMHGNYDIGSQPSVSLVKKHGGGFGMAEIHIGMKHSSKEAGTPIPHDGLVVDSWILPSIKN